MLSTRFRRRHAPLKARAIPGGPIEADAFSTLLGHIREGLQRHVAAGGALDGVYLDLHGAMFATGTEDAEGEIVKVVRKHFIHPRTDGCGAPPTAPLVGRQRLRYPLELEAVHRRHANV